VSITQWLNSFRFVLEHPVALEFRHWTEDMKVPDESFYSTLHHITDIKKLNKSRNTRQKYGNYFDDIENR
jgi:hypothetical protein